MAFDPGYAVLGGPAPIFVQAKPSWSRPGTVTGAAVVAFVVGGLSLFGAIGWLTASRIAEGAGASAFSGEWLVYGMANLLIALALVLGGIGALGRQGWGRAVAIAGAGGDIVLSAWNAVQGRFGALVFFVLDVVVIALLLLAVSSRYFATPHPLHARHAR